MPRIIPGEPAPRMFATTAFVDSADTLTVLQATGVSRDVTAHRLPAGASAFAVRKLERTDSPTCIGVALSPKAIAVGTLWQGQMSIAVEVWP